MNSLETVHFDEEMKEGGVYKILAVVVTLIIIVTAISANTGDSVSCYTSAQGFQSGSILPFRGMQWAQGLDHLIIDVSRPGLHPY